MEENVDVMERVLADRNQKDVALIGDGLSKQHFIELDAFSKARGDLYQAQIQHSEWSMVPVKVDEAAETSTVENLAAESAEEMHDLFSTELNDKLLNEARSRLASRLSGFTAASVTSVSRQLRASLVEGISLRIPTFGALKDGQKEPPRPRWYLNETAQKIKEEMSLRGNEHFEKSVSEFNNGHYEKALVYLEKAFLFNSLNIQFYLLRFLWLMF